MAGKIHGYPSYDDFDRFVVGITRPRRALIVLGSDDVNRPDFNPNNNAIDYLYLHTMSTAGRGNDTNTGIDNVDNRNGRIRGSEREPSERSVADEEFWEKRTHVAVVFCGLVFVVFWRIKVLLNTWFGIDLEKGQEDRLVLIPEYHLLMELNNNENVLYFDYEETNNDILDVVSTPEERQRERDRRFGADSLSSVSENKSEIDVIPVKCGFPVKSDCQKDEKYLDHNKTQFPLLDLEDANNNTVAPNEKWSKKSPPMKTSSESSSSSSFCMDSKCSAIMERSLSSTPKSDSKDDVEAAIMESSLSSTPKPDSKDEVQVESD